MYRQEWKLSATIISLIILCVGGIGYHFARQKPFRVPQAMAETVSTPAPQVILPDSPAKYIKEVFGIYSDRAFDLLQNPVCHENINLDPFAVNDNTTWGGVGRDRGIFQISSYYHPGVSDACAFDYKCNIDYAWRMFQNDGYKFTRWTCGKVLGI